MSGGCGKAGRFATSKKVNFFIDFGLRFFYTNLSQILESLTDFWVKKICERCSQIRIFTHLWNIYTSSAVQSNHSVEIERLQSNFIGTEFQIFIPTGIQSIKIPQSEDVPGTTNDAISDEDGALCVGGVQLCSSH